MPIDFFMMLHFKPFRWGKGGGYGLGACTHVSLLPLPVKVEVYLVQMRGENLGELIPF